MTNKPYNICRKFKHGYFKFHFFSPCFISHQGPFDGSGHTCVEGLILEEADVASFSLVSLGEVELEPAGCCLAGCCRDKASLLSSLKM